MESDGLSFNFNYDNMTDINMDNDYISKSIMYSNYNDPCGSSLFVSEENINKLNNTMPKLFFTSMTSNNTLASNKSGSNNSNRININNKVNNPFITYKATEPPINIEESKENKQEIKKIKNKLAQRKCRNERVNEINKLLVINKKLKAEIQIKDQKIFDLTNENTLLRKEKLMSINTNGFNFNRPICSNCCMALSSIVVVAIITACVVMAVMPYVGSGKSEIISENKNYPVPPDYSSTTAEMQKADTTNNNKFVSSTSSTLSSSSIYKTINYILLIILIFLLK